MPHKLAFPLLALASAGLLASACGRTAQAPSAAAAPHAPQGAALVADGPAGPSPHWLPPGATRAGSAADGDGSVVYFSPPGRANGKAAPGGQSPEAAAAGHPATQIAFRYGPPGSLTPPLDDPVLFVAKSVSVAGEPATLVEQANGLGDATLTWHAGETDFQLSTQRLATADGQSGVDDDVLLRIAASVH